MKIKQTFVFKFAKLLLTKVRELRTRLAGSNKKQTEHDEKKHIFVNPTTELAINEFKRVNGTFGGFALAESSVRCFLFYLLQKDQPSYHICEFGTGQSTIFWNILGKHIDLSVTAYEHDPDWARYLIERINHKNIAIKSCELMQIDDKSRQKMFKDPARAMSIWIDASHKLDKEQYKNPTLRNAFYNIQIEQFPSHKVDAIILDGPHGNGRSICFPLFFDYIHKGTIILLDDYHHYPFLNDLSELFRYEIVEKRHHIETGKGWVVLRITEKSL